MNNSAPPTGMSRLRVGLLGAGRIGSIHAQGLFRAGADIVTVRHS